MIMEDKILNGCEYIFNAINNISNFFDFDLYKPEILKALIDIRTIILNSLNDKKIKINKKQFDINKNFSISKNLGLKFNYDDYLNTDSVKNSFLNTIENEHNSIFTNDNFENQDFKFEKNLKKNFINENENNEKNILTINKNNIIKTSKKKHITKVADLILKINNDDGIYEILIKLFGEDLIDKLLSRKDEKFIFKVEEAINNIEELRKKDLEKEIKNKNIKTRNKKRNNKSDNFIFESNNNLSFINGNNNKTVDNKILYSIKDNNLFNQSLYNQKKNYADRLLLKQGLLKSNFSNPKIKNSNNSGFSFNKSLRLGLKKNKK